MSQAATAFLDTKRHNSADGLPTDFRLGAFFSCHDGSVVATPPVQLGRPSDAHRQRTLTVRGVTILENFRRIEGRCALFATLPQG